MERPPSEKGKGPADTDPDQTGSGTSPSVLERSAAVTETASVSGEERPATKRTELESDPPASARVLTEETAIRPSDAQPHPAERVSGRAYAFARFDEEGGEDATTVDGHGAVADVATAIIPDLPLDPFLECVQGKDLGRVYVIKEGLTRVGRALDGDVVLTDVSVSRRHFSVERRDGVVRVLDQGSGNGTRVNGAKVPSAVLKHGDLIVCGETELAFRVPGVGDAPALAPAPRVGSGRPRPSPESAEQATVPMAEARRGDSTQAAIPLWRAEAHRRAVRAWAWVAAQDRRKLGLALLACVVVLVVFALALGRRGGADMEARGRLVADALAHGRSALEAERWMEAREAFGAALTLEPESGVAKAGRARAEQAIQDQAHVDSARGQLAAGQLDRAEETLRAVTGSSPLAVRAEAVRTELASHRRVLDLLARAERAIEASRWTQAEEALSDARSLGVALPKVDAVAARLARARKGGSPPREERVAPTRGMTRPREPERFLEKKEAEREKEKSKPAAGDGAGGARARALELYARSDFAGASEVLRAAASKKGAPQKEFLALADRIERFAKLEKSLPGLKGVARIEALRSAVVLDRVISGGVFAKRLEDPLVAGYMEQAEAYARQGNDFRACENWRQAATYRPKDSRVRGGVSECEDAAGDLVDDAESAARDEPGKARDLLRKAMLMVPPTSSVYVRASKVLAKVASAGARDDDE